VLSASAWLRKELIAQGDLGGQRRSLFAVFAAIQLMRTLKHSNEMNFIFNVASTTDERPIPQAAVGKYLSELDGAEPENNEIEAAWTFVSEAPGIPKPDEMLGIAMDIAVKEIASSCRPWNGSSRSIASTRSLSTANQPNRRSRRYRAARRLVAAVDRSHAEAIR